MFLFNITTETDEDYNSRTNRLMGITKSMNMLGKSLDKKI